MDKTCQNQYDKNIIENEDNALKHTRTNYKKIIGSIILCGGIYFLLSATFIYLASYTDHRCPQKHNTPTQWTLPKRLRKSNDKLYPLLNESDWQVSHYKTVNFPSRSDKVTISGWYTEINKKAPVVIVVHGIRPNCKSNYESLLISAMLAKGKINVLNIDLQNYGDSSKTSKFISYGQKEYLDILGAYDWLRSNGYQSQQIGVAGLSLGAVTGAIAFSQEQGLSAIWLDSPYADFNTMFCYELNSKYLPCFFSHGVRWLAKTFLGVSPDKIKTTDAVINKGERAIFITHGTQDTRIPFSHAESFVQLARQEQALISHWFVDGEEHLNAMLNYPRLYQAKMVAFFKKNLQSQ